MLESLEKAIEIYGEPVYGASNQFWVQKMHRMMLEDECGVMFTGQGGNYTISWPPPELGTEDLNFIHTFTRRAPSGQHRRMLLPYVSRDFLRNINRDHFIHNAKSITHRQTAIETIKKQHFVYCISSKTGILI